MQEHSIAPYEIDASWLITASSYLINRFDADCERIQLPAKTAPGGTLHFGRGLLPPPPQGGRLARLRRAKPAQRALPHENVFDLRRNAPGNWAHFLNNHLPLVLHICDQLGVHPGDALLVLPGDIPSYICAAADALGLRYIATDDALTGQGILYDVQPWTALRSVRATWVRHPYLQDKLHTLETETAPGPKRVFLSRKDTRNIVNEAEVSDWLAKRGFVTLYPEDLSAAEQIILLRHCEIAVGVHGAGLAPLLFAAGGVLRHMVEILHAGHMTDVYRDMAQQVGCGWIGVRGRIKPKYVTPAYTIGTPFKTYSLESFDVDIRSLDIAFETAGIT